MLFLLSSAFHLGVWVTAGTPSLEGPVSWRKPMTFGISTGVLSVSLAWVIGLLPQTAGRVRQVWLFSLLLIAEVALIDMQQWRGVASHFNNATRFDGAVFTAMGVLITSAAVLIAVWTVALFRQPLSRSRGYGVAARAGMVMLNIGNLVGMIMAASEATALKPIHGVALHMIQVLPVLVWLTARLGYPRAWRGESTSSPWYSSPGSRHL